MRAKGWVAAFLAAAAISAGAVSNNVAGAAPATDNNQTPIENHAENGSIHIISDDTLEPEVVDPPSILAPGGSGTGTLIACTSSSSADCAGLKSLSFVAHLPACDTDVTVDCIASVSATDSSGTTSNGTFSRYFPNQGPTSYTGNPSMNLPSGRAPSVWSIPGAPHSGGANYAVIARLRGSTAFRSAATFQMILVPVSEKSDADTSGSYQPPQWTAPGRMAGPAADRGLFRCAYWGDNGACLLGRDFPTGFSYTVSVRLAVEPAGWLHGRIDSPTVTFAKEGSATLVTVKAKPVQVPAFQVAKQYDQFPSTVQKAFAVDGPYGAGGSRQPGGQYRMNPAERNAEYNILAYTKDGFDQLKLMIPVLEDKATFAPWIWRLRTLSSEEMTTAGTCLTSGDGVKGLVTTNAAIYGSGPPVFNTSTSSLDYKVAAPHYLANGEVFKGSYNMIIKSSVARCIYKFTDAPISSEIIVVEENGTTATAVTSVAEADGWLKLSASGFTHSAPTMRVTLTQAATAPTVAAKKSVAGSTLAKKAGLTVAKTSKVTLSRSSKYAKVCAVVGSQLRGLKAGTCVVTVKVTTGKKSTSRSVTVTVN